MSQIHKSRSSLHPFIQTVWYTRNITDGVYISTPDGSWDLILGRWADGTKCAFLTGHATRPKSIVYTANTSAVVISFVPSVSAAHLKDLVDGITLLSNKDAEHFEINGHVLPYVSFEKAEELVDLMIGYGLIQIDKTVESVLANQPHAVSQREIQRHFKKSLGITHKKLQQILRAQKAIRLLKKGKKKAEVTIDTGYTDQPHFTKSLKKIMGTQPSKVDHIHKV